MVKVHSFWSSHSIHSFYQISFRLTQCSWRYLGWEFPSSKTTGHPCFCLYLHNCWSKLAENWTTPRAHCPEKLIQISCISDCSLSLFTSLKISLLINPRVLLGFSFSWDHVPLPQLSWMVLATVPAIPLVTLPSHTEFLKD